MRRCLTPANRWIGSGTRCAPPGSGTMTPQLHPSEIRAPAPEKRAGRKRLRALQIGVAAAAVAASFAAAAYVVTQLPEEPAPKVTFNRIDDWPEIKNGVPALAPPKPAPADPAAAVAPPPMPERAPLAAAPPQPIFAARPPEQRATEVAHAQRRERRVGHERLDGGVTGREPGSQLLCAGHLYGGLLYPGGVSETESLLAYGYVRFASKAGQLAGNHCATIETGHDNALANDYSSTAYWYQRGRSAPLPSLPAVATRLPRPDPPELTRGE